MKAAVVVLFATACLSLAACSEKTEELSTTAPTGTLPVVSEAGTQGESSESQPTASTSAVAAPGADDSGFDADTTRTGQDAPPADAPATTSDGSTR